MSHGRRISVIGLGYVGLPVAMAFARQGPVVGFDIDAERIRELESGSDRTRESHPPDLKDLELALTSEPARLAEADFHIVAVPTPVDAGRQPDMSMLYRASGTIGSILKKGDIVVYESTVYPGATEEECVPILERESGLRCGSDFHVGYSPERINPGDRGHTLDSIVKVVSAQDADILDIIERVYRSVVSAGTFRAPSIRVAEAAKAIENIQRDINIALMNELAIVFDRLDIDTADVIEAAATKWNFARFTPGLVGGHCIGVDPYYLVHKARSVGYSPEVILAGRNINDGMGRFIAGRVLSDLAEAGREPRDCAVTVLGITFKENVPDIRNSAVASIVGALREEGVDVQVHDPVADPVAAEASYGIRLQPLAELQPADAVIIAVAHAAFSQQGWSMPAALLKEGRGMVFDVKGILAREDVPDGIRLRRL